MRISRATTSPAVVTTSRRVEFVPQSTAATAVVVSLTPRDYHSGEGGSPLGPREPQTGRRPRTDGVVAPRHPPGHMGMEALAALPRAPPPAARPGARPLRRDQRVTFRRVAAVGLGQRHGVDFALRLAHPTGGLQAPDLGPQSGGDAPGAG